MKNLCFFDTETTGLDEDAKIVQLAYRLFDIGSYKMLEEYNNLFDPKKPIDIGAMAVCHITNKMVEGKPEIETEKMKLAEVFSGAICVAHNASYDNARLEFEGLHVPKYTICTKKVAQSLLQNEDEPPESYGMQYLRYWLDLDIPDAERVLAHDALGDIIVLEKLFWSLVNWWTFQQKKAPEPDVIKEVLNEFVSITKKPLLLKAFPFGKHAGVNLEDIPTDYLQWAIRSLTDISEDLEHTIKTELSKR